MSKTIIERDFWADSLIIDEYSPEDKLFMLYLLTCPRGSSIGIFKLPIKLMAFEIGYSPEAIRTLIDRFQNKYNRIKYDFNNQEIAVKNALKYSIAKGGKPVEDMVARELREVENDNLIEFVYENMVHWWKISERTIDQSIKKLFEEELIKRGLNINANANANANANSYPVSYDDSYKALNSNDCKQMNDTTSDRYDESSYDSKDYVQFSTNSDEWLVKEYFYSHIKSNSTRDDEAYIDKAILKYGWEEVLLTMITLKEEQKATINTFKYVQTAIERKHDQYLEKKASGTYDWLVNRRIESLRSKAR